MSSRLQSRSISLKLLSGVVRVHVPCSLSLAFEWWRMLTILITTGDFPLSPIWHEIYLFNFAVRYDYTAVASQPYNATKAKSNLLIFVGFFAQCNERVNNGESGREWEREIACSSLFGDRQQINVLPTWSKQMVNLSAEFLVIHTDISSLIKRNFSTFRRWMLNKHDEIHFDPCISSIGPPVQSIFNCIKSNGSNIAKVTFIRKILFEQRLTCENVELLD